MKSIWNGSISFGLVNIPIKLYSAKESKRSNFRMLHKDTHKPIRYRRTCEGCEDDVDWKDIVKGVEVSKGEFYVLSDEELDQLKPKRTDNVEIIQFIDMQQIDPIYIDKHYFIGPSKKHEKPYFLFREVLQKSAKSAIGRFVMREKEYICAIEAYKEGLLLITLNFADEIRSIDQIEELKDPVKVSDEELKLGNKLIEQLTAEEFDMTKFEDTFSEELEKLIKKKAKGEKVKVAEGKKSEETEEKDLVESLKASLR